MGQQPLHIRIFLSSPGDLTDERKIARQVIDQLGYDPAFYGKITFGFVAWEQEGSEMFMPATLLPQEIERIDARDVRGEMKAYCDQRSEV